jgi:hypothetical protein
VIFTDNIRIKARKISGQGLFNKSEKEKLKREARFSELDATRSLPLVQV